MISIYKIKPKFQQLLKPILVSLHKLGITANHITISSIFLSLFIGICFWYADKHTILFLVLPVGLFIRMALNALDGMMARTFNQQSQKGEILNELGDIVSDLFIFFPLIKFELATSFYLVIVFICMSIINEFSGLLGKVVSGYRRYDGPMGKSDRAFVMGVYGILSFFEISFRDYSVWIFLVLDVLLFVSTTIRIKKAIS